MPTYETLFITPPTLAEEDEKAVVDQLAGIVTEGGGAFHANDRMGRRRLAFPIHKHEDGVYTRFLYDAALEVPRELERRMRLSDRILRSLTVRLEPDWAEASKVQAVRDAERRVEAAAAAAAEAIEAEKREAEEAEKREAEEAEKREAEEALGATESQPTASEDAAPAAAAETAAETPAEATPDEAKTAEDDATPDGPADEDK